jgi:hypothetical protein
MSRGFCVAGAVQEIGGGTGMIYLVGDGEYAAYLWMDWTTCISCREIEKERGGGAGGGDWRQ